MNKELLDAIATLSNSVSTLGIALGLFILSGAVLVGGAVHRAAKALERIAASIEERNA